MIQFSEIESLRHTEYNSDPVIMEMLDTIETLWQEKFELMDKLDKPCNGCGQ